MMRAVRLVLGVAGIVASIPAAPAGRQALGYFEQSGDVGQPAIKGSTLYDPCHADLHHRRFGHQHLGQPRRVPVRVAQTDWRLHRPDARRTARDGRRPASEIRLDHPQDTRLPTRRYVDVAVHGDGLTSLQFRKAAAAITEQVRIARSRALTSSSWPGRAGRYTMSVARFGETFTHNEVSDIDLGDEVYVGLFVCSHNAAVSERAAFNERANHRAARRRLGPLPRLHRQQPRTHGRRDRRSDDRGIYRRFRCKRRTGHATARR